MAKKYIYIALFMLLGILLIGVLLHALLEITALHFLVKDFRHYGLGLSWQQWYLIHHVITSILFIVGAALGFTQGRFWWRILYIEKRHLGTRIWTNKK